MRRLAALLCGVLLSVGCTDLLPSGERRKTDEEWRRYPVVPVPRTLRVRPGEFRLDRDTRIMLSHPADPELRAIAGLLADPLRAASGLPLPLSDRAPGPAERNAIMLRLGPVAPAGSDERYRLLVTGDGASLTAATPVGLFRGVQTLRQLLPAALERGSGAARGAAPEGEVDWAVPAVEIDDAPRFPYRGMHLDVSRHFFPVEFVKKYVDLLALYKFNYFHWHLTDDQGWRIEIRKYPRLTQVGAWRRETVGNGVPHGGFYTQEQIREVVAYAAARHVTIVPEIEMPGHARAAIAAYPELSCPGKPVEVATTWGILPDVLCPTEETFRFVEDVLAEVVELFPGPYVHVGGDEVLTEQWAESPAAREVMRREGLTSAGELEGYFIRRVGRFLDSRGRRLVGWDEIGQWQMPPRAVVMSWRGVNPGVEAARKGHDVVMTPYSHLYFDTHQEPYPGNPPGAPRPLLLEDVYGFDPVPSDLTARQARHVLGAQGNLWTEYIGTPERAEYMAVPRMLALSEVVWSPREARDWRSFRARLPAHLARLDRLEVRYHAP